MTPQDFWRLYVPDTSPGQFMCQYHSRNPARCVERYVTRLPGMYGVMRQGTWRETFDAPVQCTRDIVKVALIAYLDETRPAWEAALAEQAQREQEEHERAAREAEERAAREAEERAAAAAREAETAQALDAAPAQAPTTQTLAEIRPEPEAVAEQEAAVAPPAGRSDVPERAAQAQDKPQHPASAPLPQQAPTTEAYPAQEPPPAASAPSPEQTPTPEAYPAQEPPPAASAPSPEQAPTPETHPAQEPPPAASAPSPEQAPTPETHPAQEQPPAACSPLPGGPEPCPRENGESQ